jgi:phenylalanyl-tRNA synthetase alpha subunit
VNGGAVARNRVLPDQHVARQSHGVFLMKKEGGLPRSTRLRGS